MGGLAEMLSKRYSLSLLTVLLLWVPLVGEPPLQEEATETSRDPSVGVKPMDVEGLEPKLVDILTKYYGKTFGGAENWDRIQSVQFDGVLHHSQGKLRFTAFKKKPNYSKVVIYLGGDARLVMAYDGEDAWQLNTMEAGAKPTAMPPEEARNFIRDATIGGHLLFPLLKGKEIKRLGVNNVERLPCYQIEVKLPDGQRILSELNVGHYSELSQTTQNAVSGLEEQSIFSDFREVDGVRFPFASVMKSGGEVVHRVEMLRIQVNIGIMPWMFERASAAYIPEEKITDTTFDLFKNPEVGTTPKESFGEEKFGESAFPELDASDVKSILEDIDINKPIL